MPVPKLTSKVRTLPKVFLVVLKRRLMKMKEKSRVPCVFVM
jgi:hypothetical protein